MKGIGIGISDFKALRIRDNYFIDKSMYIKDIIDNQSGVILLTRPRRFGKTLNMSMLRYYFDIKGKDNKELFKDLKIMKEDEYYTSKLGYYPVIYLTLKDARVNELRVYDNANEDYYDGYVLRTQIHFGGRKYTRGRKENI